MSWRLLAALGANLGYLNVLVLFSELTSRTLSVTLHAGGSAAIVFFFVGALLLYARPHPGAVHPFAASLLVPVGLLGGWLALERSAPPTLPALAFALPLLLIDVPLLRWVGRAPKLGTVAALAVAMPALALGSVVLERKLDARSAAQLEAERAAYLAEHVDDACQRFVRSADDFEPCQRLIAETTDVSMRWKRIRGLVPPLGTSGQRTWLLATYVRTWTELPDEHMLEQSIYVREALAGQRLTPELRALMTERLEMSLRKDLTKSGRAQAKATIAFVRGLE